MAEPYVGNLREFNLNSSDWNIHKARLQNYFKANEIVNEGKKRCILLNMMDEDAYKLIYNLSSPTLHEERTYEKLTQLLDKFFAPQKSVLAERYKFYESKKHEKESAKEWTARVRSIAVNCEFGAELEICLRDKFVCGFEKGPILDRMLEEKNEVSFDKMSDVANNKMAALENYKIPFVKEEPINHVRTVAACP
ncbi:hypothetical protein QE152_g27358 [Popillia japonica]|uniref:Uncharacterized protein n=1 Tax=Popillia japonica TaxID=7064 RepID=A0AAW1JVN5_POPJA